MRILSCLTVLTLCACASTNSKGSEVETSESSPKESALNQELRQFGQSVTDIVESLKDPSTKSDPGTLRGRIAETEEELRQKTAGFRERMNEQFPPGEPSSEREAMEERLDRIESQLDTLREHAEGEADSMEGDVEDDPSTSESDEE